MKKIYSVVVLAIFALIFSISNSYYLISQDEEFENYSFTDEEEIAQKTPYFALSFGGNISLLFMDYTDINKKSAFNGVLVWDNIKDMQFSGPLVGWGFNFFTALSPLVNNARLGISYQSGSQEVEMNQNYPVMGSDGTTINITNNTYRSLSVSTVGLHFDYAIVPFKSLAILPGIGLKFGTMTLEEYTTAVGVQWNNSKYYYSAGEKLGYSFVAIEPQINIEYALTGFLMLKANCAYSLALDNPFVDNAWTINGNNSYSGVPKGVSPKGFNLSFGLYLGLFNY